MPRLGKVVALLVLSLLLTPRSADAYFWAWLDDWSGPRFMGTEVEWRVWCKPEDPAQNRPLLLSMQRRLEVERIAYEHFRDKVNPSYAKIDQFTLAVDYARVAEGFMQSALHPPEKATDKQVNFLAVRAIAWRAIAAAQFKWAKDLWGGKPEDPMKKPEQPPLPVARDFVLLNAPPADTLAKMEQRMLGFGPTPMLGLTLSACNSAPLQRERQFVSLKFGWAFDAKDRNRLFDHRMVTIGASYNVVATPFLTVGSGGGLAVLTSKVREPLYKFYVTPTIVDVRPLAIGRNGGSRGPWAHVFFLRYSTMVVPTGFAPDSFGGQTERYSAELTNNLGLHADLTPVIRKLQGRW
jgi:hypothetical protein